MRRPSGAWRVALLYLLLLGASHGWRALRPSPDARLLPAGLEAVQLRRVEDGTLGARDVRTVYRERVGGPEEPLPVLLLHGSPGSLHDFDSLGAALARERHTLAPDLPGFGRSTRDLPDTSIAAHADYALQLLDTLGLERVHVLGFSMGGGVALHLADRAPERVASVTLLSAIGVQELELLGDHHLNHGLHGLQLAVLWVLHELVPHFGALDGVLLSVDYGRNFFDSDQRPLRGILERLEAPTLLVHGRDDVLVPFSVALEHERIVPQSELVALEGSHFLVFTRGEELAEVVAPFLADADAERAPTRSEAAPERLERAAEPFDPEAVGPLSGLALAVFGLLAALATFVSEDLTCIAVGALVGQGRVPFVAGTLACFLGIWLGDLLLFLAGRVFGRRALGRWPWKRVLSEERLARSSAWMEEKGPVVILLSRFVPGTRLPTYFGAGMLRTSFLRFNFWFLLAAVLWTPVLVWLASRLGGALTDRVELLRENVLAALAATVAAAWLVVKVVRPALTRRGRRLLAGSWRRKVRWEYWPRWVFYPPIALACVLFAIRRRSALAFTAANPGIPHGGLVGESKADILRALARGTTPEGRAHVPHTLAVPAGALPEREAARRRAAVDAFLAARGLGWPVVVKPDVGQRGDGVTIVHGEEELEPALAQLRGRALVQEFLAGPEFGIFYARHPDEPRGRLLSVARKVLPAVRGDGRRTLEELILADERAVVFAERFLARHAGRLAEVPEEGEMVRLGELGTHCRGAAFLEGRDLVTPELEETVEALARGFDGFCFGRFDVRATSEAALRAGRFGVLELNGVTSEAAHVYDPAYGVLEGWRTIAAQWRLAFDIGLANARRGARVSRPGEVLRALWEYRRLASGRGPLPEGVGTIEEPSRPAEVEEVRP